MTAPRQVLPGRFYLVTRRCLARHFFLRPSAVVNQVFAYVLALASQRYADSRTPRPGDLGMACPLLAEVDLAHLPPSERRRRKTLRSPRWEGVRTRCGAVRSHATVPRH